jgi:two-component system, NarL family, response regulator DevR
MTRSNRPRVLLVDDHSEILVAVHRLLKSTCEVVGSLTNPLLAIETASTLRPDVIVLDLNMPDVSGLDLCREIVKSVRGVRVVILTAMIDDEIEREAYRRGASAFVGKSDMALRLPSAIRELSEGEPLAKSI